MRDDLVSSWLGRQLRGRGALLALLHHGIHLAKDVSGIARGSDAKQVAVLELMRRVVAQTSPDLGREAVKLSTLADTEPRKNGAALEDSGKNRVASRMSGGIQSEQTLAHEVVSRGCLLNVKGRADVEVAKDRDRQEPNLDLQHRATQA